MDGTTDLFVVDFIVKGPGPPRNHVNLRECNLSEHLLGGALLLIDANGHGGAVSGEELAACGKQQQQVDWEQGLGRVGGTLGLRRRICY